MILRSVGNAAAPNPSAAAFYLPFMPSPSADDGEAEERWASLIGIVTAIVGNVLISFALNIQRYAHIRLEREVQEKEMNRKQRLQRAGFEAQGYGTQPDHVADDRITAKAKSGSKFNGQEYGISESLTANDAADTDPLIPATSRPGRNSSDSQSSADSTLRELAETEYKQRSYLHSPYWWAGIILMTFGEAGNFLAYGFAPASIVSPLGVVALVSNCIVAPVMFKEPFRKRDFLGVAIAVAGAVTVVLSANEGNPKLGPDLIWDLITTWEFETYLGITIGLAIGLMAASRKYGSKSIVIDLGLVGIFGGYTALSTKGVASLLSYTLWHILTFPITYLLLFILIFTAVMQIKYVNRALQRFDATQVIPTQFVLFTLSVILGSAVLYRDFERTNADHAGKFIGGCAMTFLGVWLITSKRPRSTDEEDRDPEPVDAINLANGEQYRDSIEGHDLASGTMRASSPPLPISSIPRHLSPPSTPNITVTPHDSTATTPASSFPNAPHALMGNPWETPSPVPQDTLQQQHQPPLPSSPAPHSANLASLSTPVLPSTYQGTSDSDVMRPRTPRDNSDLVINTQVLRTPQAQTGRLNPERPISRGQASDVKRHSIAGPSLTSTPLFTTSPLSSSLSTLVAELRRGNSNARNPGSPLRPGGLRRNTTEGESGGSGGPASISSDRRRSNTENVTLSATETNSDEAGKTVRRGRSVSGTLNDIFRWMGDGGVEASIDEEQGHSEQR